MGGVLMARGCPEIGARGDWRGESFEVVVVCVGLVRIVEAVRCLRLRGLRSLIELNGMIGVLGISMAYRFVRFCVTLLLSMDGRVEDCIAGFGFPGLQ